MNEIIQGDCLEVLKTLPDKLVNCIVTSPPYYGLRDYGHDGQIGLEETPEAYVQKLVEVFREARRVLKDDGTLWLNLGDSYSSHKDCKSVSQTLAKGTSRETAHNMELGKSRVRDSKMLKSQGLKNKDLIGIPWMVAFALRQDGWYLRQDIIWHKPNPMPESVTDRCTKSHEYIFLLSKSQKYYYDNDAIKKPITDSSISRLQQNIDNQNGSSRVPNKTNGNMKSVGPKFGGSKYGQSDDVKFSTYSGNEYVPNGLANKRSVWTVTTKPFKESHFATFPEDLIVDCIKAGCPEEGIVLDPFGGAMTTPLVAHKLGRKYLAIELNTEYIKIGKARIYNQIGLFNVAI